MLVLSEKNAFLKPIILDSIIDLLSQNETIRKKFCQSIILSFLTLNAQNCIKW